VLGVALVSLLVALLQEAFYQVQKVVEVGFVVVEPAPILPKYLLAQRLGLERSRKKPNKGLKTPSVSHRCKKNSFCVAVEESLPSLNNKTPIRQCYRSRQPVSRPYRPAVKDPLCVVSPFARGHTLCRATFSQNISFAFSKAPKTKCYDNLVADFGIVGLTRHPSYKPSKDIEWSDRRLRPSQWKRE